MNRTQKELAFSLAICAVISGAIAFIFLVSDEVIFLDRSLSKISDRFMYYSMQFTFLLMSLASVVFSILSVISETYAAKVKRLIVKYEKK